MLLHILIFACSSPTPDDALETAHHNVLSGYQTAEDKATALNERSRELQLKTNQLKSKKWTREEANALLRDLQNSRDTLEASVQEIETALGNISRSLHTSHHSR